MSEQKHWLDFAEIGAAVVSAGGAIATAVGQSAAYATIPLSVSVILNLLNRNRLVTEMLNHHHQDVTTLQGKITDLEASVQSSLQTYGNETKTELNQLRLTSTGDLEKLRWDLTKEKQTLGESLQNLEQEKNQLAKLVGELQQIENLSQAIRTNPSCADFYYRRGLSHQNLADKHGAIGDYSKAIELDSNHAPSHHQRGILHAEFGNRRQAVEDLRRAAKLYFEQGDIDSYQQARDLSKEFHEIHAPVTEDAFEKIKISNFLS